MRKERAGAKGGLGEDEVVGLQPQQLSLVDASHRACVTDLHWLPGLGINREGRPPSRPASVCPSAFQPCLLHGVRPQAVGPFYILCRHWPQRSALLRRVQMAIFACRLNDDAEMLRVLRLCQQ